VQLYVLLHYLVSMFAANDTKVGAKNKERWAWECGFLHKLMCIIGKETDLSSKTANGHISHIFLSQSVIRCGQFVPVAVCSWTSLTGTLFLTFRSLPPDGSCRYTALSSPVCVPWILPHTVVPVGLCWVVRRLRGHDEWELYWLCQSLSWILLLMCGVFVMLDYIHT